MKHLLLALFILCYAVFPIYSQQADSVSVIVLTDSTSIVNKNDTVRQVDLVDYLVSTGLELLLMGFSGVYKYSNTNVTCDLGFSREFISVYINIGEAF